jgi:hypothetical protein
LFTAGKDLRGMVTPEAAAPASRYPSDEPVGAARLLPCVVEKM